MKYRFTAEDFEVNEFSRDYLGDHTETIANIANAILEKWEQESEKVYGSYCAWSDSDSNWSTHDSKEKGATHTAILWNVHEIDKSK